MKKRLLAALLSLSLLAALVPSAAFAAADWTYYPNRTWMPPGKNEPYDHHDLLVRDNIYVQVAAAETGSNQLTMKGEAQKYPWPADVTEFDFNGAIQDKNGTIYTITYMSSYPGRNTLTKVTLPNTVTALGQHMSGSYCVVQEITLPASLQTIEDYALQNCSNLTTVHWNDAPVTTLGSYVFAGCTSLGSIALPDSITSMGSSVFAGCTSLASVDLPDNLTALSFSTFSGCTSLESVEIPEGVTRIERNTFQNCSSLRELTLPGKVSYIGLGAFDGCTSLKSLTFQGNTPPLREENYQFPGNYSIYVPEESLEAYRQAWPALAQRIWAIGSTPETYNFSLSASALSFGEMVGGRLPEARTLTLTNTGTGELTLTLPASDKFTLTGGEGFTGSTATLQPGDKASFTVQPKALSSKGEVSEQITLEAEPSNPAFEKISASFTASFTVKIPRIQVGGAELGSGAGTVYALTDESGAVTTQGASASRWNIRWEGADYTLTLKDATLSSQDQIAVRSNEGFTLVLEGENHISGAQGGISTGGSLALQGGGSLEIRTGSTGIYAVGNLTVRDLTLDITADQQEETSQDNAIRVGGGGMIQGSSLTLRSAQGTALDVTRTLTVTDSTLNARGTYGLTAGSLTVDKASELDLYGPNKPLSAGTLTLDGQPCTEPILQSRVRIREGRLTQEIGALYVGGVDILAPGAQLPQGVSYDPDTYTLTLADADLSMARVEEMPAGLGADSDCGIYTDGQLTIRLKGSNALTGQGIGIYCMGGLTVEGPGSLEVLCQAGETLAPASIAVLVYNGEFTQESGALTLQAADAYNRSIALYTSSHVTLRDGRLELIAGDANGVTEDTGGFSLGINALDLALEGGTLEIRTGDVTGQDLTGTDFDLLKVGGLSAGAVLSTELRISGGYLTVESGRLLSGYGDSIAYLSEGGKDLRLQPSGRALGLAAGSTSQDAQPLSGSPYETETSIPYDQLKGQAFLRSWTMADASLTLGSDIPAAGAVYGQPLTFTAEILSQSAGAPAPAGPVEFWLEASGQAPVSVGKVNLAAGRASLTLEKDQLPAGSDYRLVARYADEVYGQMEASLTFGVSPRLLSWDASALTASRSQGDTGAEAAVYGLPALSGLLEGDTARLILPASGLFTQGLADKTLPGRYTVTAVPAAQGESFGLDNPNYALPQTGPSFLAQILPLTEGGTVQTEAPEGQLYRLQVTQGLSLVPQALAADPALNTPQKLEELLRARLTEKGAAGENIALYEVELLVSGDGGKSWQKATADNFPAGGLTLTLPYPTGTGKATHDFTVAHLFTTADFGKTPGQLEYPAVTKTDEGIRFTVTGLSPIGVSWQEVPASGGESGGGSSGGSSGSSSAETPAPAPVSVAAITPLTGDNARLGLWAAMGLSALAIWALAALAEKKARRQ